jgi:hypothetical protein
MAFWQPAVLVSKMNDANIARLKKWTRNGVLIGLVIGFLNSTVLGKSGYEPFSVANISYIFGHVAGVAVLALLAARITNAFSKS